jgi:hypothetical protein
MVTIGCQLSRAGGAMHGTRNRYGRPTKNEAEGFVPFRGSVSLAPDSHGSRHGHFFSPFVLSTASREPSGKRAQAKTIAAPVDGVKSGWGHSYFMDIGKWE